MIYDVMCVCVCVCVCVGVEGVLSAEKISHIFAQPHFSHASQHGRRVVRRELSWWLHCGC
jgi:hypothetical protein